MRTKFYPEGLKAEAVRLVVERRQTIAEVALQMDIPSEAVRVWVRRFRSNQFRQSETNRLRAEMREMTMERNVLMKLASRLMTGSG